MTVLARLRPEVVQNVRKTLEALARGEVEPVVVGDVRDRAVPLPDQVLGDDSAGTPMRKADRELDDAPVRVHHLGDRDRGLPQHRAGGGGMAKARDRDAARPPRDHVPDESLLDAGVVSGNPEDRLQGRALQAARHPRQHLRKDLVRHRRDEHPHEVRPLPCERAGDPIRHVADGRGRAQHPLPGRGGRIARVAQHPRDGHLADPGAPGDVAQRAGAHRPGTASVSKSGRGSVRGGSSGNAVDMEPGPDDIRNHSMFALTHPGSTDIVATAVVT